MGFTNEQIRAAIISLFKKYDKDGTGYIDGAEIQQMCTDLSRELGKAQTYDKAHIDAIMKTIDRNMDGRITKDELYVLMRKLNPA